MKTAVAAPSMDPRQALVDLLRAWQNLRITEEYAREQYRICWVRMDRWAALNRCRICGGMIESSDQVGRCYYADPCGHRQGQGRAPA